MIYHSALITITITILILTNIIFRGIFEIQSAMTSFDAGHEDLIHDVAYDFYGKRLVTCSSDQRLKVREFVEETGVWEDVATWKVHG